MRYQGRIVVWKDEKGFGFIAPNGGDSQIFLHISEFSERRRRPSVGDLVTYQVATGDRGKPAAHAVAFVERPPRREQPSRSVSFIGNIAALVVVCAIGYSGYLQISDTIARKSTAHTANRHFSVKPTISPFAEINERQTEAFRCEGKTHCSQMSSCKEATFYLENCPNVEIDGDHDGVPCEQQLCD